MGRHVMEALGRARVVIEDGKVVEIGEPRVKYCPLFKDLKDIDEFDDASIRENIEYRIRDFGMCCENRKIRMGYLVKFGISEIMSMGLIKGILDSVVLASDGCGTVVLEDPEIVQGMGGRISGIVETCPIPAVVDGIGRERILDPETARIDQRAGVAKAVAMGCKKIAVTLTIPEDAEFIRRTYGDKVILFAVHTTGISREDAEMLFDSCDIITACASKHLRDLAEERTVIQAGTKVPVYGVTEIGKKLMHMKLEELGKTESKGLTDSPRPLD